MKTYTLYLSYLNGTYHMPGIRIELSHADFAAYDAIPRRGKGSKGSVIVTEQKTGRLKLSHAICGLKCRCAAQGITIK